MITVIYRRDDNRVSVEGHALSGEKGHDLVCASASILVYTLASFVENMMCAGQSERSVIELEDGRATIEADAPAKYKPSVTFAFDTVCAGFELLAKDFPDNISYEIMGE